MMSHAISNIRITIEDGLKSESTCIQLSEGETGRVFFDTRLGIIPVSFMENEKKKNKGNKDMKLSEQILCSLFLSPRESESIAIPKKECKTGARNRNRFILYGAKDASSEKYRKIWISNPEPDAISHTIIQDIDDDSITIRNEKRIEVAECPN